MAEAKTEKSKFETWLSTAKAGDEYVSDGADKTEINKAVTGGKVVRGSRKVVTKFVVRLK